MLLLRTEVYMCTTLEYDQHPNLSQLQFIKILLLEQRSQILEKLERKTKKPSPLLLHAMA